METSVVSRLTSWESKLPTVADEQQASQIWWNDNRENFDLFISEMVLDEIAQGDPVASSYRIQFVQDIHILTITDKIRKIARELLVQTALPSAEEKDAIHIACAAVYKIDYLLTWNCKHIANPNQHPKIQQVLSSFALFQPRLITPEQLNESLKSQRMNQ
jgi:predicted nucleic acid-binding protein